MLFAVCRGWNGDFYGGNHRKSCVRTQQCPVVESPHIQTRVSRRTVARADFGSCDGAAELPGASAEIQGVGKIKSHPLALKKGY